MSKYDDILARLKEATGPDRKMDGIISTTAGGFVYEKRGSDRKEWFYPVGRPDCYRRDFCRLPRYTGSIDAALGLVEKLLPGWKYSLGSDGYESDGGDHWARVFPGRGRQSEGTGNRYAPTAPLALLIALFSALKAQEPQEWPTSGNWSDASCG